MSRAQDHYQCIDLSDNELQRLENFPLLKNLETLLLHNNRISRIAAGLGASLPGLRTLMLTNNQLAALSDLEPLAEFDQVTRASCHARRTRTHARASHCRTAASAAVPERQPRRHGPALSPLRHFPLPQPPPPRLCAREAQGEGCVPRVVPPVADRLVSRSVRRRASGLAPSGGPRRKKRQQRPQQLGRLRRRRRRQHPREKKPMRRTQTARRRCPCG